jgi:two-component system, OmpR family, response regulator
VRGSLGNVRVLVVEDEAKLADLLRRGLAASGLAVDVAATGEDALWMAPATAYQVIILDLMLPDVSGIEVCRRLRDLGVQTPILMLTALAELADRVAGLDSGADDYLGKPFALAELLARIRALARRTAERRDAVLRAGGLRLDPAARRVWRNGTEIALTAREFALLESLIRRPGQTLSRFELLEDGWDEAYENRSNVIDVYIGYLRDKIDRPFGLGSIVTVRGHGYRLEAV